MAEFALVAPILIFMFIAIADFGRIFASIVTIEAATRNAAEAVANQYLALPPGSPLITLADPAPPGDANYYNNLHAYGAGVVCAELRSLPNTNYDSVTETCPDMPFVLVCVHDSQDPSCATLASAGSSGAPTDCSSFSSTPDPGQGAMAHPRPRWVEVRTCYHFTAILNSPLFSLGNFWLQQTNEFTIPCYFALGSNECGDVP